MTYFGARQKRKTGFKPDTRPAMQFRRKRCTISFVETGEDKRGIKRWFVSVWPLSSGPGYESFFAENKRAGHIAAIAHAKKLRKGVRRREALRPGYKG